MEGKQNFPSINVYKGIHMVAYLVRRFIYTVIMLFIVSIIGFFIIELPPGDYLTVYVQELSSRGDKSALMEIDQLRVRYGLDEPAYTQYWKWISHFVQGDFGDSFKYRMPVNKLVGDRMLLTVLLTLATMVITWMIAIPIGIYSATHQYSWLDQVLSALSFIGLGTPGFLLALVVLYIAAFRFNSPIGGLFSQDFENAPWSLSRIFDLLKHLWIPALITGATGTASVIRIMRGNLLDTLRQPFVLAARAKGLKENVVIYRHAVRLAINPLITILGLSLPDLISGVALVSIVMNLPTAGPLFLEALQSQDMYLAGSFLMFMTIMLVVGNFLADIALAWVDPRVRYD
jgi:peptide/nickel transport system permease protein